MRQNDRRLSIKRTVHAPNGVFSHGRGTYNTFIAIAVSNMVHGLIEVQGLLGIFEQVDLVIAADQMTETDAYQAHQQPSIVQCFEHV